MRKVLQIDYGTGFANRAEFYDKMIQWTNHPDGIEIFKLDVFESVLEIIGKMITDLSLVEIIH